MCLLTHKTKPTHATYFFFFFFFKKTIIAVYHIKTLSTKVQLRASSLISVVKNNLKLLCIKQITYRAHIPLRNINMIYYEQKKCIIYVFRFERDMGYQLDVKRINYLFLLCIVTTFQKLFTVWGLLKVLIKVP